MQSIGASQTDRLNFFLIWGSLLLATIFPFELFLFSYAVLGPLHYMTEINWLEKKNYFLRNTREKKYYVVFSIAGIALLALAFFIRELDRWEITKSLHAQLVPSSGSPLSEFSKWGYSLLFAGLLAAVVFHLFDSRKMQAAFLCIAVLLTFLFFRFPVFSVWVGIFLPTVIHVFFFTVLFMWAGTQRSGSGWGVANLISMGVVIWFIVAWPVSPQVNSVSTGTLDAYLASNFHHVNFNIGRTLGLFPNNHLEIYSPAAWKIQVFISFAYTYHYLNWFSKTTVIGWHQVNRKKMAWTLFFWVISVVLYALNYRLGFVALFVMSMMHVILEFPLNVATAKTLLASPWKKKEAVKSRGG